MPDRIETIIVRPRFVDLPLDVQGVGQLEYATELMSEIAKVDRSTIRMKGTSEGSAIDLGGGLGLWSLWQHNAFAVLFYADGEVHEGIVAPIRHEDRTNRIYSVTSMVRDL